MSGIDRSPDRRLGFVLRALALTVCTLIPQVASAQGGPLQVTQHWADDMQPNGRRVGR